MAIPVLMDEEKKAAARRAVEFVRNGQVVGLGSGSTSTFAIHFLAGRVKAGLDIVGIPTSVHSGDLATQLGIPLTNFDENPEIDVTIDGADEVDPALNLIKGGGGAMLREKVVASASRELIIVADSTKLVPVLGGFPLPVEVIDFAQAVVARRISALGAEVTLRRTPDGKPYLTDEGHHILDCRFGAIRDPATLAQKLDGMPGLVEHGLFINLASVVLVAKGSQVTEIHRPQAGGTASQR